LTIDPADLLSLGPHFVSTPADRHGSAPSGQRR
jgi:hypothetical protein